MDRNERQLYEKFFKQVVTDNIRHYRMKKGWTQSMLADAIDVSHEFIRSLESEKGKKSFSAFTVFRISKALGVSLDDLLDFDMDIFRPIVEKSVCCDKQKDT